MSRAAVSSLTSSVTTTLTVKMHLMNPDRCVVSRSCCQIWGHRVRVIVNEDGSNVIKEIHKAEYGMP